MNLRWFVAVAPLVALLATIPTANASQRQDSDIRVRLGIHNFQSSDAWPHLAEAPSLVSRLNCDPTMTSTRKELRAALQKQLEGPRGLLVGCGTGPGQWKYRTGPMSGASGPEDIMGPGSAATPTVKAYSKWVRTLRGILRGKMWRFQVWNEGNLHIFYRGSPSDLVDLTFAAARVLGRRKVLAPSFTLITSQVPSGGWRKGRILTQAEFIHVYWRLLAKRAAKRGKPLPVAAATFNGYGTGANVDEASESRIESLRAFRNLVIRTTGNRRIRLIDTEFNLRSPTGFPGFPDSPETAQAWKESVVDAACLGFAWQYAYTWTDRPALEGWLAQSIQFTPETNLVNRAFKNINGKRVRCD